MIVGNLVDFSCFALIIASIIAGWSLPLITVRTQYNGPKRTATDRFTKQYLTPASTALYQPCKSTAAEFIYPMPQRSLWQRSQHAHHSPICVSSSGYPGSL